MTSSNRSAGVAAVFGALAVLATPAAALASRWVSGVTLLSALYVAVPVTIGLAAVALLAARRARRAQARSVFPRGSRLARTARWLAWIGLYIGAVGALALAVYGVLRWAE
jgi:hypothetical protein